MLPVRVVDRAFAFALGFRLLLVLISHFADHFLEASGSHLQYTDVDYHVFSDAALLALEGESPYKRYAFRYPPILAWLLVPNHVLFPEFGKVLFCLVDASIVYLVYAAVMARGQATEAAAAERFSWAWAINPFTAVICSRGSSDSIVNAVILGMVDASLRGRAVLGGLLLGLAVHLRLYPIIYFPSLLLHTLGHGIKNDYARAVRFALAFLASFVACTAASLWACGPVYLDQALFYHFGRSDHRHNFSPAFYTNYLEASAALAHHPQMQSGSGAGTGEDKETTAILSSSMPIMATALSFAPQALLLLASASALAARELELCLLAQTLVFVALNRVSTAQYFTWYLCFLPLALHRGLTVTAPPLLFAAILALWLWRAESLEMRGNDTFLSVWACSLGLMIAQAACAAAVIRVGLENVKVQKQKQKQEGWRKAQVADDKYSIN